MFASHLLATKSKWTDYKMITLVWANDMKAEFAKLNAHNGWECEHLMIFMMVNKKIIDHICVHTFHFINIDYFKYARYNFRLIDFIVFNIVVTLTLLIFHIARCRWIMSVSYWILYQFVDRPKNFQWYRHIFNYFGQYCCWKRWHFCLLFAKHVSYVTIGQNACLKGIGFVQASINHRRFHRAS